MGVRPAPAAAPNGRASRARSSRSQGAARRTSSRGAERGVPGRAKAAGRPSVLDGLGSVDASSLLSRFRVPIVVVAVALFVLVSLYPPVQELYCAWRDQGVQQQTLEGLNASIEEYQGDISRLQTREGIEDEARRRGFVDEGEVGVVLEGDEPEEKSDATEVQDQALPWYVTLGDVIFQYEGK